MKSPNRRPEKPDRQETDYECALQSQSGGSWSDFFEAENQLRTQLSRSLNEGGLRTIGIPRLGHHEESSRGNG